MIWTGRGEAAAGQSPWALGIPSRSSVIFGKYRSDLKTPPGSRHGCLPPTSSLRGYLPGPAPTKGDEHEPGPEMPAAWEVLLSRGPEHKCSHGPQPGSSAAACTAWAVLATYLPPLCTCPGPPTKQAMQDRSVSPLCHAYGHTLWTLPTGPRPLPHPS